VVYKGQLGLEEEAVMVGRTPFIDLKPKDPTLVCPDGSVQFTVVGGKPPYTWSTTKGEITPDADTKSALLTPPPNLGNVFAEAYRKFWVWGAPPGEGCGDGCYLISGCRLQVVVQGYQCNDAPATSCGGAGGIAPFPSCIGACTTQDIDLGNGPKQYCASQFATFTNCAGTPDEIVDLRTQSMIDAGCRPCEVEMQGGAIVTVTDSEAQSAGTTVMVE
jgi:hypothetical protein